MTGRVEHDTRHPGRLMVVVDIVLTSEPKRIVRGFPVIRGNVAIGDVLELDDVSREWVKVDGFTGRRQVVNVVDASVKLREEVIQPPRRAPRNQRWVWVSGEWKLRRRE